MKDLARDLPLLQKKLDEKDLDFRVVDDGLRFNNCSYSAVHAVTIPWDKVADLSIDEMITYWETNYY